MRRAFSLIEIMIVVALLALLASLVLPTAFGALRRGEMARTFDALNDALIEATADASRSGKPVRVSLERPGSDDLWSLWVRASDGTPSGAAWNGGGPQDDATIGGGGLLEGAESSGRVISAFPIDVEIGTDPSVDGGDGQLADQGATLGAGEALTLAIALPGGGVIAGEGLLLDEADGERRWRVAIDELAGRFVAIELEPADGLGQAEPERPAGIDDFGDDNFSDEDGFDFDDDWFEPSPGGRRE